ncbi:hypothetical protein [Streptomyces sp. NPDC004546]
MEFATTTGSDVSTSMYDPELVVPASMTLGPNAVFAAGAVSPGSPEG